MCWRWGCLVGDLKAMERAAEFAERADDKAVWSRLAKAQLAEGCGACYRLLPEGGRPQDWPEVVSAAEVPIATRSSFLTVMAALT